MAACYVNLLGKRLWIVVDGAYIKKPFLKREEGGRDDRRSIA